MGIIYHISRRKHNKRESFNKFVIKSPNFSDSFDLFRIKLRANDCEGFQILSIERIEGLIIDKF